MNNIFLLAKRELGYYLNTIWGYAILAIILVIDGILFNTFAMGANTERYSTDVLQDFFFFSSGTTCSSSSEDDASGRRLPRPPPPEVPPVGPDESSDESSEPYPARASMVQSIAARRGSKK